MFMETGKARTALSASKSPCEVGPISVVEQHKESEEKVSSFFPWDPGAHRICILRTDTVAGPTLIVPRYSYRYRRASQTSFHENVRAGTDVVKWLTCNCSEACVDCLAMLFALRYKCHLTISVFFDSSNFVFTFCQTIGKDGLDSTFISLVPPAEYRLSNGSIPFRFSFQASERIRILF